MTPSEPAWTIEGIRDAGLRARLRRWTEEAIRLGIGPAYRAAVAEIRRGLTTDPLACGDPLFDSPALGMTTFHRSVFPLHVTYAVHPAERVVWVLNILPYPESGLSED